MNENREFWAVWRPGMEWPEQYASMKLAKERVHCMAKANVGSEVTLFKMERIGTVKYPLDCETTGVMKE